MHLITRPFWFVVGLLALALGFVGIFLPLLPTVPFLILAAYCFARSSSRLHHWLVNHARLGPPIRLWTENGAIGRRAKQVATLSIAVLLFASWAMGFSARIIAIQAATLCLVMLFIWTRPES